MAIDMEAVVRDVQAAVHKHAPDARVEIERVGSDKISFRVLDLRESLAHRCPQEEADRLLESDPTCIQLAKSRGLTPAQFLAWLRKEEHADGAQQVLRRIRLHGEDAFMKEGA